MSCSSRRHEKATFVGSKNNGAFIVQHPIPSGVVSILPMPPPPWLAHHVLYAPDNKLYQLLLLDMARIIPHLLLAAPPQFVSVTRHNIGDDERPNYTNYTNHTNQWPSLVGGVTVESRREAAGDDASRRQMKTTQKGQPVCSAAMPAVLFYKAGSRQSP